MLSALLDALSDRECSKARSSSRPANSAAPPRINRLQTAGRNHWDAVQTVLFAAGGVQGGNVVGSSDKIGGYPVSDPQTPDNMANTIYKMPGIPKSANSRDSLGRLSLTSSIPASRLPD